MGELITERQCLHVYHERIYSGNKTSESQRWCRTSIIVVTWICRNHSDGKEVGGKINIKLDKIYHAASDQYQRFYKHIGYSYEYCGGNLNYQSSTNCNGKRLLITFWWNSAFLRHHWQEPMSCIIGDIPILYHSERVFMNIRWELQKVEECTSLASCGPMGLGAISYMLNCDDRKPSLLVITDIDQVRLIAKIKKSWWIIYRICQTQRTRCWNPFCQYCEKSWWPSEDIKRFNWWNRIDDVSV